MRNAGQAYQRKGTAVSDEIMWVRCNACGYEMNADFSDCRCEQCGEVDWSAPYPDDDEPTNGEGA